MVRRRGPRLTLAEKTELWRRWRRGESLNAIARELNTRPRKTLGYRTPAVTLAETVASTG